MAHLPDDVTLRHLARVVESSDDAIISKDLDGVILSWNRAAERIFGYTAAEAVGQSIRLIIPSDRQAEEDMVLARIRAGRGITHFETIRQRKDGAFIPISLTVSPIHDDNGRVIGASKIARDITERTAAAVANRRLAAVVESSDDAIITKDLEGTITSWNAAAERMFGYTSEEAIGRSIRMLIPDELQGEEDVVLARIRAGEKIEHYETVRQRRDRSRLSISLTVSPIRTEQGEIVGASKIARDITEPSRLKAVASEEAANTLKLSEVGTAIASTLHKEAIVQSVIDIATELTHAEFGAFFYSVVDRQSGDTSMRYTLSGAVRDTSAEFSNPGATALFAATFHADGPVRIDDVRLDPRHGGNAPYFESAPGRLAVRSYLAVPVKGHGGAVIGGLFFGHSGVGMFTPQHERLASGVAGWAAVALENARLYADAQAANRMKDEFLAVLSHELRTPLNAIVGYSRLLRGEVLSPEKAKRGLETLERNATMLTRIVEDVLDISRIVAGKIRLDVQHVELPLMIDNAVATIQPAADAKGVQVKTAVDPQVRPILGDPGRLHQVIWNLMSNAVKFTPAHGRVELRLEQSDSQVEIIVSDTGIGIPNEFLPFVFDRFRQAEAVTTRKTGGLGLGLAIVRHIVELHGGSIEASSEGPDRGATFRVQLPIKSSARGAESSPLTNQKDSTADESRIARSALRGIRVVAVDDERDALTLMRVILEAAGAHVTTVASPFLALDRIVKAKPDVLVIDLGMPKKDGFELIGEVRKSTDPAVQRLPALALTAFARSEDRTKALRSGFQMHLAKPVDPAELVASVAALSKKTGEPTQIRSDATTKA
jgi:PAS domain S-box-containing protein